MPEPTDQPPPDPPPPDPHLSRLDVLRAEAVQKDKALLNESATRTGTPPVEPEIQPNTSGEQLTLAQPPSAAHRLRRLRLELDGLVYGDFGLFEFDRETKSFQRAATNAKWSPLSTRNWPSKIPMGTPLKVVGTDEPSTEAPQAGWERVPPSPPR